MSAHGLRRLSQSDLGEGSDLHADSPLLGNQNMDHTRDSTMSSSWHTEGYRDTPHSGPQPDGSGNGLILADTPDQGHSGLEVVREEHETGLHPVTLTDEYDLGASRGMAAPATALPAAAMSGEKSAGGAGDVFVSQQYMPPPPAYDLVGKVRSEPLWRQRRFIIIGGIALLAIVVGAVVGGVLGSRASQKVAVNSPSESSSASVTIPPRVHSTEGAWNGTSLTVISQNSTQTKVNGDGLLFYQDYTGDVKFQRFVLNNQTKMTTFPEAPRSLGLTAAPGSAMAGSSFQYYDLDNRPNEQPEKYLLVYVDKNGTLCDIWTDDRNPNGPWIPGNLSSHNFKAPTDSRVKMTVTSTSCWGLTPTNNSYGIHVYAGGTNGQLNGYSYDFYQGVWYDGAWPIDKTFSYGGLDIVFNNCVNTTLYSTGPDGKLNYFYQLASQDQHWPTGGGPFTDPQNATHFGDGYPASGIWAAQLDSAPDTVALYYAGNDTDGAAAGQPRIEWVASDTTQLPNQQWTSQKGTLDNVSIMPGSDMAGAFPIYDAASGLMTTFNVLFFQNNGSAVMWRWIDNENGNNFGSIVT